MVPSICPLETLHNSLSLKQVDDFLTSIATCDDMPQESTPSLGNYLILSVFQIAENC